MASVDATMYGNVSETDIINAINNELSKFTDEDDTSLVEYYNAIYRLHIGIFPQNTPVKHLLDNMTQTQVLIKSSPNSKLHHMAIHHLYHAVILMVTYKLLKNTHVDMLPIKQAVKTSWERFIFNIDNYCQNNSS